MKYSINKFEINETVCDIDQSKINNNIGIYAYPVFNQYKPYMSGTIVRKNDMLYKFIKSHSISPWNENDVIQISLNDLYLDNISDLSKKSGSYDLEFEAPIHTDILMSGYYKVSGSKIVLSVEDIVGDWVVILKFEDSTLNYNNINTSGEYIFITDELYMNNIHGNFTDIQIYIKANQPDITHIKCNVKFGDIIDIEKIDLKLDKQIDEQYNGYIIGVNENNIEPLMPLYSIEKLIISKNIYDYNDKSLINYYVYKDSSKRLETLPSCLSITIPFKVHKNKQINFKCFDSSITDKTNGGGILLTKNYPTLYDTSIQIGYLMTHEGFVRGYLWDIIEDSYVTIYIYFKSSDDRELYYDSFLKQLVVFESDEHTWPTEYEEYRENIIEHSTFLETYSGVENAGKMLIVNSDGYISTKQSNDSYDISDCIVKQLYKNVNLGPNLINAIIGTGNGWIHNDGVYTHQNGYEEPLTFDFNTNNNEDYIVVLYTGTSVFYENQVNVSIGNMPLCDIYRGITGPYYIGLKSDGGKLKITPSKDYTNTVLNIELRKIIYDNTEPDLTIELSMLNVHSNTDKNNISAMWNVAIGPSNTLEKNINGSRNIAIGLNSMSEFLSGERNVAIGTFALNQLRSGHKNIAIGADALYRTSYADNNVAIGKAALGYTHTDVNAHTYDKNTAIGNNALTGFADNYINNTAVGYAALGGNITGNTENNTAVGYESCMYGSMNNVAIGYRANRYNRGSKNVHIGSMSGGTNPSINAGDENILIGFNTLYDTSKTNDTSFSNSICIGSQSKISKSNQVILGNIFQTEIILLGNKLLLFNDDGTVTWTTI